MKQVSKWLTGAAAVGMAGAFAEYLLARYFVCRAIVRENTDIERTKKMAGIDWDQYIPKIKACRERIETRPHEDIWIRSQDGLNLHGMFFPQKDSKQAVLCFHGYTSEVCNDYALVAEYYLTSGYNVLCVDERAHGKSEGTYIGFGCLERYDVQEWTKEVIHRIGEDCQIILYGISMGAATVLMATGLELPKQVRGAISDCAFTSAWDILSFVLKNMYHLPAFPTMQIADHLAKKKAGYSLKECNACEEVKKSHTPTLFIHGDQDTFVPCSMAYKMYKACTAPKELFIVKGAGHTESYYKEPEKYQTVVQAWAKRCLH